MFLFFTSDASVRYLQDVLDATAYPNGHVIHFRYHDQHVDESIRAWSLGASGQLRIPFRTDCRALLIYLERPHITGVEEFSFYPFRQGKVRTLRRIGSAIYADILLTGYPAYERDDKGLVPNPLQSQAAFTSLIYRPLLPLEQKKGLAWYPGGELKPYEKGAGGHGGFFLLNHAPPGAALSATLLVREPPDQQQRWESVVEALGSTKEFRPCTFFRIAGMSARLRKNAKLLEPEYHIPSGEYSSLSCRVLRPKSGHPHTERHINVHVGEESQFSAWPKMIAVDSRYNERQVVVSSKRVLDRSAGTLAFDVSDDRTTALEEAAATTRITVGLVLPDGRSPSRDERLAPRVTAPQLLFLFRVVPPRLALRMALLCVGVGAIVVSLGPDSWDKIVSHSGLPNYLANFTDELAGFSKILGGLIAAWGAWLTVRKLPVRT